MRKIRMQRIEIELLDHGYIRPIEIWGKGDAGINEAGIIEAARMSTQGSFRGWEQDEKLLAYLYNNKHSTPFEFCGMIIEVQAPIFVFREWHRHRTQSYNEMSARYEPLPDFNYVPTIERLMKNAGGTNKQAGTTKDSVPLTEVSAVWFRKELIEQYNRAQALYVEALSSGVPKELARTILPVCRYSRMRASANLRNWLAFLTLRDDPNAQEEIQVYAKSVGKYISEYFPRTWNLFQLERGEK